jgi:OmcA/MtrC family decaheme c-type cytochrome
VICHNANQTDIPYRTSGAEVSIDFKRMVHGIHAGGFRETPLQIVGFQGVTYDFSTVRFLAELRNCNKCHVNGSYALPISAKALGSTVDTRSVQTTLTSLRVVDVDPSNDVKITPTAAVCSGCHDKAEVRTHMIRTGGASFSMYTGSGVVEKCVNCHGPGKSRDVKKMHELSR